MEVIVMSVMEEHVLRMPIVMITMYVMVLRLVIYRMVVRKEHHLLVIMAYSVMESRPVMLFQDV
jgi:hypothetical protein